MSIRNYIRPQLTIKQLLDVTADRTIDRLNPVVIGPAYHVEALADATPVAFDSLGFTAPYSNLPEGGLVDAESVKLFANALQLAILSGTGTIPNINEPNVVKLDTQSNANSLRVGDIFRTNIAGNSTVVARRIVGFRGVSSVSSYDVSPNESSSNPSNQVTTTVTEIPANPDFAVTAGTGTFSGLVKGATYNGKYGDLFTLRVTTPGAPGTAVLQIRSNSGLYDADNVPTTLSGGGYAISGSYFDGLQILLGKTAARDLQNGDVISFQVAAAYVPVNSVAGLLTTSDTGSGYTGPADTQYLIRVTEGGALGTAKVQVVDTAGVDVVQTYTPANNTNYALGSYGLRFRFNSAAGAWNNGLKKGDVYVVPVTAAAESTTSFDKIVLDGPAANLTGQVAGVAVDWSARLNFTGEINPKSGPVAGTRLWTVDANGVVVGSALTLTVSGRGNLTAVDDVGTVSVTYRAIVPPAADEGILEIGSDAELTELIGEPSLANVLAYGVQRARAGAQGRVVYAVRTAGNDAVAFGEALNKIRNTDTLYALAVLSNLDEVKQLVASHVSEMSAEGVKNFRRAYVGTDSPAGGYGLLVKQASNLNFTATIVPYLGTNTRLVCAAANFISAGAKAGDVVRINYSVDAWGAETYESYVVKQVLSESEVLLKTGPATAIADPVRFEIWKPDTAATKVAFVKAASRALNNRRVANVWCDRGTSVVNGSTVVVPNMFLAAEIAGLRCAVLPQQGLTNTEISTITNAPSMYLSFSQADLDEIAAEGTFVVTQDGDSGNVYIRHQLTTRTDSGSLYYEDSVGVNLDSISFGVKDILTGYIGKRNANNDTLVEIKKRLSLYLNDKVLTSPTNAIGPALISFTDPLVEIDANFKDTINVFSQLTMPLPLNQIVVTLRGSTQV